MNMNQTMNHTMFMNHTMGPTLHMNHTMGPTMHPNVTHGGHAHHTGHGTTMNHHMGHGTTMNHHKHGANANGSTHGNGHAFAYFTIGNSANLFFEDWKSDEDQEIIGMCVFLFILAILYEGFKVFRQVLMTRYLRYSYDSDLVRKGPGSTAIKSPSSRFCSCMHFLQTLLHMVQVFVGYLLMLAFMTYNVWLCVAVIVGSGVGYLLFGWKTATLVSNADHCN